MALCFGLRDRAGPNKGQKRGQEGYQKVGEGSHREAEGTIRRIGSPDQARSLCDSPETHHGATWRMQNPTSVQCTRHQHATGLSRSLVGVEDSITGARWSGFEDKSRLIYACGRCKRLRPFSTVIDDADGVQTPGRSTRVSVRPRRPVRHHWASGQAGGVMGMQPLHILSQSGLEGGRVSLLVPAGHAPTIPIVLCPW